MSKRIRITDDNSDDVDTHFIGVMIEAYDWDVGNYSVPGWECRHCGWRVGTAGLPPSHMCPDDGQIQDVRRNNPEPTRPEARAIVESMKEDDE